jgi:hypothetical protein
MRESTRQKLPPGRWQCARCQDVFRVKTKIRQQLQFLRDRGYLDFVSRDRYRLRDDNETGEAFLASGRQLTCDYYIDISPYLSYEAAHLARCGTFFARTLLGTGRVRRLRAGL